MAYFKHFSTTEQFTVLDDLWAQGKWHNFKDEGYVSRGSATRKFSVWDRRSGAVIGSIKWHVTWRQYMFFPFGHPLSPKTGREILDFCEVVTRLHKQKRDQ